MVKVDRIKELVNVLSTFSFAPEITEPVNDPVLFFNRQDSLATTLDLMSFYFKKYDVLPLYKITLSAPPLLDCLDDDDDDEIFVSTEVKLVKRLPFDLLHLPCLYYSFALWGLNYIDILVEDRGLLLRLGYPSLYYFFERCLHPDPVYRHWLYI